MDEQAKVAAAPRKNDKEDAAAPSNNDDDDDDDDESCYVSAAEGETLETDDAVSASVQVEAVVLGAAATPNAGSKQATKETTDTTTTSKKSKKAEDTAGKTNREEKFEATWQANYALLKQFHKENGHSNVPLTYKMGDALLGLWVHRQRLELRKPNKGQPEQDDRAMKRAELLRAVGLSAEVANPRKKPWSSYFELLRQFASTNGHCRVPKKHRVGDHALGTWLDSQKRAFRERKITQDRWEALSGLGVEWGPSAKYLKAPEINPKNDVFLAKLASERDSIFEPPVEAPAQFSAPAADAEAAPMEKDLSPAEQKKRSLSWDDIFQILLQYRKEHGHFAVPSAYKTPGGIALGLWVRRQRSERKKFIKGQKAETNKERIDKLNAVGFLWDPFGAQWEAKFDLLQKFRELNGHVRVPGTLRMGGEPLGDWVKTQRKEYNSFKAGKYARITQERIDRLTAIGFAWNIDQAATQTETGDAPPARATKKQRIAQKVAARSEVAKASFEPAQTPEDIFEARWQAMLLKLVQHHTEHGNCNGPYKDGQLEKWVQEQRDQYELWLEEKPSELTPDRIERLNAFGFDWSGWEVMLTKLVEHKTSQGTCGGPYRNKKLGKWVEDQRNQYQKLRTGGESSTLTPDRVERLDALGFAWTAWDAMLLKLTEHKMTNGEGPCRNRRLGKWVKEQRRQYQLGLDGEPSELTASRVERLNALGFAWNDWDAMFLQLVEHKSKHAKCEGPYSDEALKAWIDDQRQQYRNGLEGKPSELTADRMERLNSLGFAWTDWDAWFLQLEEHKSKQGNCLGPYSDENLALWVDKQRKHYRQGLDGKLSKLTPERMERLSALGFDWSVPATKKKRKRPNQGVNDNDKKSEPQRSAKKSNNDNSTVETQTGILEKSKSQAVGAVTGETNKDDQPIFETNSDVQDNGALGSMTASPKKNPRSSSETSTSPKKRRKKGSPDALWNKHFANLVAFREQHGHTVVPSLYIAPDGTTLGRWVKSQRNLRNCMLAGKSCDRAKDLTKERYEKLNEVGFVWEPFKKEWEDRFELLSRYMQENEGRMPPPTYVAPDGTKLGTWVTTQKTHRERFIAGKPGARINQQRIDKLSTLGFKWTT